jgi:hypothetical protein
LPLALDLGALALGWWAVWRWALRGSRAAMVVMYILYLPIVLATLIGLGITVHGGLGLRSNVPGEGGIAPGLWLVYGAILALLSVMVLLNFWEKGLWTFLSLDGRCPFCRVWHFGRIKRPCLVICPECGADLEFVRDGG